MKNNTEYKSLWQITGALVLCIIIALSVHAIQAEDDASEVSVEVSQEDQESGSTDVRISTEAMSTFGISVDEATSRVPPETAIAPARVSYNAEAMAHVGTPVSGRAGELNVRLGDIVAEGDILAVIESPELGTAESDLLQKKSLREAAESAVEVARIAYQRAEELRKANSVSVSDLLSKEGDLKKAGSDLKVAEAAYLAAENHLHIMGVSHDQIESLLISGEVTSQFEVKAPISGNIVQRAVTPGEVVGPDRETLFIIADMSTLWVLADVPSQLSHRLDKETPVRIRIDDAGNYEFAGVISYVSPELDPRTRTASVRIVLDADTKTKNSEESSTLVEPVYELTEAEIAAAKDTGDWCGPHDAPESRCPLCGGDESRPVYSQAVIAVYQTRGDWCPEHRRPESTCQLCNSGLSQQDEALVTGIEKPEVVYSLTDEEITAAKDAGDWCGPHDAPESRCPLCGGDEARPVYSQAVIEIFKNRNDWCSEHRLPESKCVFCNFSAGEVNKSADPGLPAGRLLKPGMFGTAEFQLTREDENAVLIREEAVQTMAGYPLVFIPNGENQFTPREVALGEAIGDWVPVLSGLREGEDYVVGGSFILKAELGKAGVVDPCTN